MEKITKRRWLVGVIIFLVSFFLGFGMSRFERLGNFTMFWLLFAVFVIVGIYLVISEPKLYRLDEFERRKNLQIYAYAGNFSCLITIGLAILSLRSEFSGFLQNFHWYQIFGIIALLYITLVIFFWIFYYFFPPKN